VIEPVTHAEQMRRIREYATAPHCAAPAPFVTWTLKYIVATGSNRAQQPLRTGGNRRTRSRMARPKSGGKNITQFGIHSPMLKRARGCALPGLGGLAEASRRLSSRSKTADGDASVPVTRLCSRASGPAPGPLTMRSYAVPLRVAPDSRGTPLWARGLTRPCAASPTSGRATCAVSCRWDDTEVTDADVRTRNLILFETPAQLLDSRGATQTSGRVDA
jgi:hypothetical protein